MHGVGGAHLPFASAGWKLLGNSACAMIDEFLLLFSHGKGG